LIVGGSVCADAAGEEVVRDLGVFAGKGPWYGRACSPWMRRTRGRHRRWRLRVGYGGAVVARSRASCTLQAPPCRAPTRPAAAAARAANPRRLAPTRRSIKTGPVRADAVLRLPRGKRKAGVLAGYREAWPTSAGKPLLCWAVARVGAGAAYGRHRFLCLSRRRILRTVARQAQVRGHPKRASSQTKKNPIQPYGDAAWELLPVHPRRPRRKFCVSEW